MAAMAVLAGAAATHRALLATSVATLGHVQLIWIPAVIVLESASIAALAGMQRRLLVGGVASAAAGGLLIAGGALSYGNIAATLVAAAGTVLACAALAAVVTAARWPWLRGALERPLAWILRHGSRLLRRPVQNPAQVMWFWTGRLRSLRLPLSGWMVVAGLALANWLADAAVLTVSIHAVGAAVPWHVLLLAYGSGVGAQSVNITPGGVGITEGTLGLVLVASGLRASQALAAVLLYRLVSFWLVASAGWLVFLRLRTAGQSGGTTA